MSGRRPGDLLGELRMEMMEMAGAALENEGGLDLRALLRLQAQAFKAAQAQIDAQ